MVHNGMQWCPSIIIPDFIAHNAKERNLSFLRSNSVLACILIYYISEACMRVGIGA
jgi:hypothetical protein